MVAVFQKYGLNSDRNKNFFSLDYISIVLKSSTYERLKYVFDCLEWLNTEKKLCQLRKRELSIKWKWLARISFFGDKNFASGRRIVSNNISWAAEKKEKSLLISRFKLYIHYIYTSAEIFSQLC